jgi:hypothetical protein
MDQVWISRIAAKEDLRCPKGKHQMGWLGDWTLHFRM